jgi:hypothetical protein
MNETQMLYKIGQKVQVQKMDSVLTGRIVDVAWKGSLCYLVRTAGFVDVWYSQDTTRANHVISVADTLQEEQGDTK